MAETVERGISGLIVILENPRNKMNVWEEALFWLAQSDSDEAFDYVADLLKLFRSIVSAAEDGIASDNG